MAVTIRDYDSLIAAFKARADEIGLSTLLLAELARLNTSFVGKVMGPSRTRRIGFDSLWPLARVLAFEIHLVPSLELAQKMEGRWEKRDELRRRPGVIRKQFSPEMKAKVMQELGRIGGSTPKAFRLSKKQRERINRRNGKKGGRPRKHIGVNPAIPQRVVHQGQHR